MIRILHHPLTFLLVIGCLGPQAALCQATPDVGVIEPPKNEKTRTAETENKSKSVVFEQTDWGGKKAFIDAFKSVVNKRIKKPKQRIGFVFKDAQNEEVLVSYREGDQFHPASNIKLLTSAAALRQLGPRFKWRTEFRTKNRNGMSVESLWVRGSGDPSFSFGDLSTMVEKLKQLGISQIKGDLFLDASVFEISGLPPGFADKPQDGAYRPSIAGLNLNWNQIVITLSDVGKLHPHASVFPTSQYTRIRNAAKVRKKVKRVIQIRQEYRESHQEVLISGDLRSKRTQSFRRRIQHPLHFFGETMRHLLKEKGIFFEGKVRFEAVPKGTRRLLQHFSKPLADILKDVNAWSNNLSAEALVLTMAAQTKKGANFDVGLALIDKFAREQLGWKSHIISNGSGLFGQTRVSPKQFVQLLEFMHKESARFPEYRPSFAVSGLDGTLRRRLKGSQHFRVFAKTGTLDGVSGLSGYIVYKSSAVIIFSILQNDFKSTAQPIRKLQDDLVVLFAEVMDRLKGFKPPPTDETNP